MMKIKKLTAVLFCFIMVVSLIGCSMGSDEKATSEKKKDGDKKVIWTKTPKI